MLIVLSNTEQYNEAAKKFSDLKSMKILCDNPAFYGFLENKGLEFEKLDEELIKEEWSSINAWACEKALLWDSIVDVKSSFAGVELNKALSAMFSYYLVSFLKNFLFAKLIYEKYKPEEIALFGYEKYPDFPSLNGNLFLNVFLEKISKQFNAKVFSLKEENDKKSIHKISRKEMARKILEDIYIRLPKHKKSSSAYLVCGELRHLELVIEEICKRGEEIIIFSHDFRVDLYRFCRKHKLSYLTENFLKKNKCKSDVYSLSKGKIEGIFSSLVKEGWFEYKEQDLSEYFYEILLKTDDAYIKNINDWFSTFEKISAMFDIKGVVVDQNETLDKSHLAAFFKAKGIQSFCISHGYGAVKFSLPEKNRKYDLSKTFLHSEFERNLFEARGWQGDELCITGIPRYDRIVELQNKRTASSRKNKKLKILYVGATMLDYTPDIASYVGVSYKAISGV